MSNKVIFQSLESIGWKVHCLSLVFICSSFFAAAVTAQELTDKETTLSIEDLLNKFVNNGSRQLFDGTFIYLFEDAVKTIQVHRKTNKQGVIREEFVPLDSPEQQTKRLLNNQYCTLDNAWRYQFQAVSSSFPFRINNHYQDLQKNYHFSFLDRISVAGIPALGLAIKAKDNYRYSYELWFEPETATLLKYKLIGHNKRVIEQYLFTQIALTNNADSSAIMAKDERVQACQEKFQGLAAEFNHYFHPNKIPQGYMPVSFRKARINKSTGNGAHTAYQFQLSDGIAAVSIFIERIAEQKVKQLGHKQQGQVQKAVNGVIKLGPVSVAGKTTGDYQITVLGAIPVSSAVHFLSAVKTQ